MLGPRLVLENGKMTNLLSNLQLKDQVTLGLICQRTYNITVPDNVYSVELTFGFECKEEPEILSMSTVDPGIVFKTVYNVQINGQRGQLTGQFDEKTLKPKGSGVF